MTKQSRGKDFENVVKTALEEVQRGVLVERLHDQMSGYSGSTNPCDFIVYCYPNILYLECKSCYGNTLSFHNITDNQWAGLVSREKTYGVIAGVMVWFIDADKTYFIPAHTLVEMKASGQKSVNVKTVEDWDILEVPGTKKRVFFDYNMRQFLSLAKRRWG